MLISLSAWLVALYLLHRLTELELGRDAADNAVLLLALFPMSFFFSAIYSESLFLALTVGCVYAARRGRWWRAAAVGGLASATRSQGVLRAVPLAIMLSGARPACRACAARAAALLLVPVGLVALPGLRAGRDEVWVHGAVQGAQSKWMREFKGPLRGSGAASTTAADRCGTSGGQTVNEPVSSVRRGIVNFAALVFAASGWPERSGDCDRVRCHALAGLIVVIRSRNRWMPKSLPRLVIVLFPIFMWAGWR